MAPEMLKNQPHDQSVDVWSLGVLLYELLHGNAPFGGLSDRDKILKIINLEIKFGEFISNEAKDLMEMLLKVDPKKRPEFKTVFDHFWMRKYEKEFNMNMDKFIYDPDKSRNRSRSKSPIGQIEKKENIEKKEEIKISEDRVGRFEKNKTIENKNLEENKKILVEEFKKDDEVFSLFLFKIIYLFRKLVFIRGKTFLKEVMIDKDQIHQWLVITNQII